MSKYAFERAGREHKAAIEAVLSRAAQDTAFRALALRDPHAAIREAAGVEVPRSYKITFAEAPGGTLAARWPDPTATTDALSEEDLEHVAGGDGCVCDMDLLLDT